MSDEVRMVKVTDVRYQILEAKPLGKGGALHEAVIGFVVWDGERWRIEEKGQIKPGPGFPNPQVALRNRNHSFLEMFINEVEQP